MKEEQSVTIYKHTSPYGKVYIGQTKQNPEKRWKKGEGYKHSVYFYNAIKFFGWDKFKHEILYTGLSSKEANRIEKELIKYYKGLNRSYNIASGGKDWIYKQKKAKSQSQSSNQLLINF